MVHGFHAFAVLIGTFFLVLCVSISAGCKSNSGSSAAQTSEPVVLTNSALLDPTCRQYNVKPMVNLDLNKVKFVYSIQKYDKNMIYFSKRMFSIYYYS